MSRARLPSSRQRYRGEPSRSSAPEKSDSKSKPKTRGVIALLLALWHLAGPHRWRLAAAMAGLATSTVIGLAPPAATKLAIDYILTDSPGPSGIPSSWGLPADGFSLLLILAATLVIVAIVELLFSVSARWQITNVQKRVSADLRRRAFNHAVRLPLHEAQAMKSGGVASLLRQDAGAPGELIGSLVAGPWRAIIRLIGTLAILAAIDPLLLAGALLLMPLVALSHRTWISRIRPLYSQIRKERSSVDAGATEAFAGLRVLRAFARERTETRRFAIGNHLLVRREIEAWWRMRAIDALWAVLVPAASALLLLYGGREVLDGRLTLGDLMMFSTYLIMLLGPIEALVATATSVQNGLAGLDRVLDLLASDTEQSRLGKELLPTARGAITFRGVNFQYPSANQPVLHDVDLDIRAGETIALVGASGAGKTTLTHLVAGFYAPTQGQVLVDGRDLADLDLESYRSHLAIVEQDVFLFDGTIADNIAWGRPDAAREAILRAADQANALEFIEQLELGFETRIGERGVRLSGGQRQRLAIARALLADPAILVLDEATSNLDTHSEGRIQAALESLLAGRTCFIIAHRLSTVRNADRIIVLDDGRILEVGTHAELLARGGVYKRLHAAQLDGSPSPSAGGQNEEGRVNLERIDRDSAHVAPDAVAASR